MGNLREGEEKQELQNIQTDAKINALFIGLMVSGP